MDSDSTRSNAGVRHLAETLAKAAIIVAILYLPRAYLELESAEGIRGSLAVHVGLTSLIAFSLLALSTLVARRVPRLAKYLPFALVQVICLIRAGEAALILSVGFGYNSLTFVHAGGEAVRVAAVDYTGLMATAIGGLLLGCWPLLKAFDPVSWPRESERTRTAVAVATLAASFAVLGLWSVDARGELPTYSLARARLQYGAQPNAALLDLTRSELEVIEALGLRLEDRYRYPELASIPERPLNLILVLLESFQNNFTAAGGSPFEGLTPNIDAALSRMTWVSGAYNSVTPTVISMTSILCGTLPPGGSYYVDRNIYSSLRCFPDLLEEAGYRQVFMGAALKSFTDKDVLLEQHGYDEIYGHEDFGQIEKYRRGSRNSWGIHDPDLIAEALDKLEQLRSGPPFNLTLLTINSHKPGYPSPKCPLYEPGNRYLNGIHCTDFALGRLFRGIDELELWDETVVVLVGDHMAFPIPDTIRDLGGDVSNNYFGNVFMAIHAPGRELPKQIDTLTHSPDVAPTVLDLMGFELAIPFALGRSLLGERPQLQHLIGPETELFEGSFYPQQRKYLASEFCHEDRLAKARLEHADELFSPCQRYRLITRVDQWQRADEESGRPPHPPIPGRDR